MPTTDGFSSSTNSLWFELLVAPVCGELLFVPIEPYPTPLLPDGSVGFYYMILCDTDDSHLQSTKGNPNETNRRGNRGCSIDAALWSSCNLDLEMNAPTFCGRLATRMINISGVLTSQWPQLLHCPNRQKSSQRSCNHQSVAKTACFASKKDDFKLGGLEALLSAFTGYTGITVYK